jgi:hypothetical protein
MNVPIHIFALITTDGAPAMTNEKLGLIGFFKNVSLFHTFSLTPGVIHQQILRSEVIDLRHMISFVRRTINWISVGLFQRRLFKHL